MCSLKIISLKGDAGIFPSHYSSHETVQLFLSYCLWSRSIIAYECILLGIIRVFPAVKDTFLPCVVEISDILALDRNVLNKCTHLVASTLT